MRQVEELMFEGLTISKTAARLQVSERTVVVDRQHIREQWQQRPLRSRDQQLGDLEYAIARLWADYDELAMGDSARAAFMSQIGRMQKLYAEMGGNLARTPLIQVNLAMSDDAFGPSPAELYEAGRISHEEFVAALKVEALQAGEVSDMPAARVIDSTAAAVQEPEPEVPAGLLLEADEAAPEAPSSPPVPPVSRPVEPVPPSTNGSNGHKVQAFRDFDAGDDDEDGE